MHKVFQGGRVFRPQGEGWGLDKRCQGDRGKESFSTVEENMLLCLPIFLSFGKTNLTLFLQS